MARRRRKNPLGKYGYPGSGELRRQARLLAAAALPTARSIRREYGQDLRDTQGFTNALVSLLRDQTPEAAGAFNPAIRQQRGINEAAMARLADLGPEYANLAGASGEGQLSGLLASQAAQRSYASRQPGIAARAGVLQAQGVIGARHEALTKRHEDLAGAMPGIFHQLQQEALGAAQSNRQFAFDQRQFAESKRQFNVEQQRLRDQFLVEQQQKIHESPFTASQISTFMATARGQAPNAINAGVGPQQFIRDAISRGIPRAVAARAAMSAYSALATRVEKSGNPTQFRQQNPRRWQAYDAYRHWREQIYRMQSRKGKRKKKSPYGNLTFGF